jgi:ATP-dependent DNA helicase RecG
VTAPDTLTDLPGIGPALAEKLAKLEVNRASDLLFLLPIRYEDRTRLSPLGSLRTGQKAVIEADIELTEVVYRRRRTMLCRVADGTGMLTLRFFYFSRHQQQALARGRRVRCYGEVRSGPGGPEMIHPEYRLLRPGEDTELEDRLTPIYPTTEGVQQTRIRKLVNLALERCLDDLDDYLPGDWLADLELPDLRSAIELLHRPPRDIALEALTTGRHPAQRRLALEEILAHHLSLRILKTRAKRNRATQILPSPDLPDFLDSLGFRLTPGQNKALEDILEDFGTGHPMMRLVQGDVGCGKTVVAAAAAHCVARANCQTAIMAPTELLAEQHRSSFENWLEPAGIRVGWLAGGQRRKERTQTLEQLASGDCHCVVGTHALFQDTVSFKNLGLVVVDEQHRFGVHQRLKLMEKGGGPDTSPHQLVMTATPIPRTLAMTAYADLDTTNIRDMPPGRQPVTTVALPETRRSEVIARVRDACAHGQQAYWVCPLIEESEAVRYEAAEAMHAMLSAELPDLKVGLVHGRMRSDDKDSAMQRFSRGETRVLVATTVIEVGVDVPAATLMIVENSERMGLAQLHQLRGRVGRGSDPSSCVLLYRAPLSAIAKKRLGVLRDTTDGFEVSRHDLELRGPGEVLGVRQTGLMQLRVADLIRDSELVPLVQQLATRLLDERPDATRALMARWIGSGAAYGAV